MKNIFKTTLGILAFSLVFASCSKDSYELGDLTPPADITVTAEPVGKDATHPNGDGSGDVNITITSDYALAYKIDYDASDGSTAVTPSDPVLKSNKVKYKYTSIGTKTYTMTVYVYGKGGSVSTATKDVTVRFDYVPDPAVVTKLTNDNTKTWVVDKSVPGHLGVGPWDSPTSDWWNAGVDEKVACCNCFYTATFKFTKLPGGYTIDVATPNGAFTKTGALAGGLPGIPATGDEACYPYAGASGSFSLLPGVRDIPTSTQVGIKLGSAATFIGYGATQREYQILSITDNTMYLRAQGTETGNAWYIKLKAL